MELNNKDEAVIMKLELHKNLKTLLEREGMTASQLARVTKVPNSTIANWLSGLEPRNLIQLKKIAEYFDVTVDFLLYGNKRITQRKNSLISEFDEEINAGVFEVVLRRIKR